MNTGQKERNKNKEKRTKRSKKEHRLEQRKFERVIKIKRDKEMLGDGM